MSSEARANDVDQSVGMLDNVVRRILEAAGGAETIANKGDAIIRSTWGYSNRESESVGDSDVGEVTPAVKPMERQLSEALRELELQVNRALGNVGEIHERI